MSLDIHAASPIEPVVGDDIVPHPNWGERIVVVVAISIAVLIVAVIAVLLGMG